MSSDPLCLNCAAGLTISPEGWRGIRDDSLTCATGLRPGEPHLVKQVIPDGAPQ